MAVQTSHTAAVDLYWIPLGAGGHCVCFNGRVFEAIAAACQDRPRCDLYHAALVVEVDGDRHAIELTPSPNGDEASRGVVEPVASEAASPAACAPSATSCTAGVAARSPTSAGRNSNR